MKPGRFETDIATTYKPRAAGESKRPTATWSTRNVSKGELEPRRPFSPKANIELSGEGATASLAGRARKATAVVITVEQPKATIHATVRWMRDPSCASQRPPTHIE
jgi:hypothetical protein